MTKYKHLLLIILAFIAGSFLSIATTVALAHGGDVSKIHACVRNTAIGNLANVRIVGANDTCNNNETALDWNIQGVPGPTGLPGPTGVPGQAASGSAYFGLPFLCSGLSLDSVADKFKSKDFSKAIMKGCSLNEVDISGVLFKNSIFSGGSFGNSNLSNADFSSSQMANVDFTEATLTNTNFSSINILGSVRFINTNLQNANFTSANIQSSNFTDAQNMDTANLTGVTWSNVTCPDGTNSDANGNTCAGHLTP